MPEITPSANIGSQIERGIIAYLHEYWPTTLLKRPNFYFSNDWRERKFHDDGLISVLAAHSRENPEFTSDKDFTVTIEAKWPGAVQPGDTNKGFNFYQINNLIGVTEALMRVSDTDGQSYEAAAWRTSSAGRRLAVFGLNPIIGPHATPAADLVNNGDMTDFTCFFVRGLQDVRAEKDDEGTFLVEKRIWLVSAYNNSGDTSIFPALTFDGTDTLDWTFTLGGVSAANPTNWLVEKSVSGGTWTTHATIAGTLRTYDIPGTGTQYWRVRRSADGTTAFDPESNVVKAIVA